VGHRRRIDHGLVTPRMKDGVVGQGVIETRDRAVREQEIRGKGTGAETGIPEMVPPGSSFIASGVPLTSGVPVCHCANVRNVQALAGFAASLRVPAAAPVWARVSTWNALS